jgi:hypothetical protein
VWTWVTIDADFKVICSWLICKRDPGWVTELIEDLAGSLRNRVQLTTNGLKMYLIAVADEFGKNIDYPMPVNRSGTVRQSATAVRKNTTSDRPIRSI